MRVIGTAGHIDHGKSTLVERLTGIDPDRLVEEKRRGMTIDLGFAWLTLPSGREASIVDVPGHERFIKNMMAGVGGIDVALLVVAADEGVMPQTREHLDILDLLGINNGVVAVTKTDLADDEWIDLVEADVRDTLEGSTLAGAPIVRVSARSGAGIPALTAALDAALDHAPSRRDIAPYLPIDRVFSMAGFGTVVTGTLHDGTIRIGDELEIVPTSRRARVRGLQTHRQAVEAASTGMRAAVNLAGVAREDLRRGFVLGPPGMVEPVQRFDASLRVVAHAPFALEHGTPVAVHIGSAEVQGTVAILGADRIEPGVSGWVQVRLSEPVGMVWGQRFVLRLPSPARTIAGGVALNLKPRHRRSDQSAIARLAELASDDVRRRVNAVVGEGATPVDRLAPSLRLEEDVVRVTLRDLVARDAVVPVGGYVFSAASWASLVARADNLVGEFHRTQPLKRGMPAEELRQRLRLDSEMWPPVLRALADHSLHSDGALVRSDSFHGPLDTRDEDVQRVLQVLEADPYGPPTGQELLQAAGVDRNFMAALVDQGFVVRLGGDVYLARTAFDTLVDVTMHIIEERGTVSVSEIRDAVKTSRKYALAFLEGLDAQRITRRVGDARVKGSRAPACA